MNKLREIREACQLSQGDLGKALGVTSVAVGRYEKEDSRLNLPTLRKLAASLNCRISDIIGETDYREVSLADQYASVPVYDVRAAAGAGALVEDGDPVDYQLFMRGFLRSIAHGRIEDLTLIRVAGDSMWDTLHDGDDILVDRSVTMPGRDGIYVLRAGTSDEIQVKRLQWQPEDRLRVISDNPIYDNFSDVEPGKIQVLGKVVWIGRKA